MRQTIENNLKTLYKEWEDLNEESYDSHPSRIKKIEERLAEIDEQVKIEHQKRKDLDNLGYTCRRYIITRYAYADVRDDTDEKTSLNGFIETYNRISNDYIEPIELESEED